MTRYTNQQSARKKWDVSLFNPLREVPQQWWDIMSVLALVVVWMGEG